MRPDSACLYKLLLSEWGQRALCTRSCRGAVPTVVPTEFGVPDGTDSEAIRAFNSVWRQFFIEEASASALKEAEDEVRRGQAMPDPIVNVRDGGFADVTCRYRPVHHRQSQEEQKLVEV